MAAASVRAITAKAGMPSAAFHYAFHDKDELLELLIVELPQLQLEAALSGLSLGTDLADALRLGFQAPFLAWIEHPDHHLALLELTLHALRVPDMRDLAERQYHQYFANVEQFLRVVSDQYDVDFVPSLAAAARMATAVLDGITLSWLTDRDDEAALAALAAAGDAALALTRPRVASGSPA
jgi:TetR/AcrR family transcriptional regulator, regulator of biofilm formation and stress response